MEANTTDAVDARRSREHAPGPSVNHQAVGRRGKTNSPIGGNRTAAPERCSGSPVTDHFIHARSSACSPERARSPRRRNPSAVRVSAFFGGLEIGVEP